MTECQHIVVLLLSAVGFFCAGTALQLRRVLYWRIKWIELEHDSARQLGREPRDISAVEPNADVDLPPRTSPQNKQDASGG